MNGLAGASLEVVGLASDEFQRIDPAKLTQRLKSVFDPTPAVRRTVVDFDGLTVGVLHVEQHRGRLVMATKQDDRIAEGDIFFRYPGQSARIKYSDLTGDAAHHVHGAKPRLLLPDILAGRIVDAEDAIQAGHIGQALQALDRQPIDPCHRWL